MPASAISKLEEKNTSSGTWGPTEPTEREKTSAPLQHSEYSQNIVKLQVKTK